MLEAPVTSARVRALSTLLKALPLLPLLLLQWPFLPVQTVQLLFLVRLQLILKPHGNLLARAHPQYPQLQRQLQRLQKCMSTTDPNSLKALIPVLQKLHMLIPLAASPLAASSF